MGLDHAVALSPSLRMAYGCAISNHANLLAAKEDGLAKDRLARSPVDILKLGDVV